MRQIPFLFDSHPAFLNVETPPAQSMTTIIEIVDFKSFSSDESSRRRLERSPSGRFSKFSLRISTVTSFGAEEKGSG